MPINSYRFGWGPRRDNFSDKLVHHVLYASIEAMELKEFKKITMDGLPCLTYS